MSIPLQDMFRSEVLTQVEAGLCALARQSDIELSISRAEIAKLVSVPPSFDMGQAALPCFPFARQLRMRPQDIAKALADSLNAGGRSCVARAEAVSGYLNVFCNFEAYGAWLCRVVREGTLFGAGLLDQARREKIVVEYSQPNTHKALHVGHLRCVVVGDAVSRILEFAGHRIVRATYPGDLGTHVAKILWFLKHQFSGELPREGHARWLGEIYVQAAEAFAAIEGTPQEPEARAQMADIVSQILAEQGDAHRLWLTTREWSFEEMRRMYRWLGVNFDVWYTESECERPAVELVRQKLAEGFFVQDQGAVGKDLSEWKLGFALFLKSDGHGLYLTKDLELMRRKFADPEVTSSIYVVDARQQYHFKQLFKTAELMGFPQAARSTHLSYETVNTPEGKAFASRNFKGTALDDVRHAMEAKVVREHLERYRGTWSEEDITRTAADVTLGALKFGLLKVDNTTPVTFLLEEWLRLDGDTGPYLQYVHARCRNILEKQGAPADADDLVFDDVVERQLVALLSRFGESCLLAATQLRPSFVANYLLELARLFNKFYEMCPIRTASGALRNSRLLLVDTTARVMAKGLSLLGIPAPEHM